MDKLKKLISALLNRETITYLVFGVLTTVVNFVTFKGFDLLLGSKLYYVTNTLAWIAAVVFAYVTNKLFVFESKSWKADVLKKEIPSFVGARVASLLLEEAGLVLFVEVLHFGDRVFDFSLFKLSGVMFAKVILAVVVVIINYVLSKFLIFAKKKSE